MNASFLLRGLLLVAALPPGIAFAQKFPDVRIDSGTDPSLWAHDPQIAAVGSSVFVTWWDEDSGIGFNRSLDGGMTWLDTALTPPGGEFPSQLARLGALGENTRSIAVSGSNVYLIWFKDVLGDGDAPIHFNRSLDGGSTWLPDAVLFVDSGGDPDNWENRICAAGSSVYVAWMDHRDTHSGQTNVYFDRSLDGGTTWLPADVRLDVGSTSSRNVDMAASGSAVHVTWEAYASGDPGADIYYNRSLDGGTTWLPAPVRLDLGAAPGAAHSYLPKIAVSGSSVYVAWLDSRDGGAVYFNASMDAGSTWLPTDLSLDGTPGFEGPWRVRIAASGSAVYATWQERTWHDSPYGPYPQWDIEFNRSLDGGMTWLPSELLLDQSGVDAAYPEIAAWGSSVAVTWFDTGPDIFLNRSVDWGATWLPLDVRMDVSSPPSQDVSLYPRVAASGSSVYVAWVERVGDVGDQGIHFNLASGYQTYGDGLAGAGGLVPTIFGGGGPSIGGTMALFLANGRGAAPGVLLYGLAGQASIPFLGGRLHVAPPFSRVPVMLGGAPGQPGAGAAALMLSIPNDVALLGLRLDFQAGFFDPGALHGVSLTGGLEAWVL